MKRSALPLLLALTIGVLYGPLVQYDYVHDDRIMIQNIVSSGIPDLSPFDKTFYRPLGTLYCHAVFGVFGMNAVGFHILAMVILFVTALVIRSVARALTGDDRVAWGAAFLYTIAAHLHLDPQMWMVGVFDNGAVLFSLLCLLAYLRSRHLISALMFAVALGFKESAAPMLLVIVASGLLSEVPRKNLRRVWPHLAVFVFWVAIKAMGASPAGPPETEPYAWSIAGWHVATNLWLYATWLAPVTLGILVIIALMGFACIRQPRIGVFLVVWALLMLLLPSLLRDHAFRYYTLHAFPAVAIGTMLGLTEIPLPKIWKTRAVVILIVAHAIVSVAFMQGHIRRGIHDDEPAVNDGYNHLIRRSLQGE